MKALKLFLPLAFVALMLVSCEASLGSITFSGQVELSPSVVKNGDVVSFSVHPQVIDLGSVSVSVSQTIKINGKSPIKYLVYYIDDVEVARSSDRGDYYGVDCKIEELSAGSHIVTAHCIPRSGWEIIENIKKFLRPRTLLNQPTIGITIPLAIR